MLSSALKTHHQGYTLSAASLELFGVQYYKTAVVLGSSLVWLHVTVNVNVMHMSLTKCSWIVVKRYGFETQVLGLLQ